MKNFEKNIRGKLKNAKSNEGIDVDALWKNISAEIATPIDTPLPQKSSSTNKKKRWLFLLLLIFAGAGIYFFNSNFNTSNSNFPEDITLQQNPEAAAPNQDQNIESKNNISTGQEKNDFTEEPITPKNQQSSTKESALDKKPVVTFPQIDLEIKPYTTAPISTSSETHFSPANKSITSEKISTQPNSTTEISTLTNPPAPPELSPKPNSDNLIADKSITPTIDNISQSQSKQSPVEKNLVDQANKEELALDFANIDELASKDVRPPLFPEARESEQFKFLPNLLDKRNAHFSLGFFAGTHALKNTFSTSDANSKSRSDLLNAAYKVRLGRQVQAELNFHLNKKLFLSTGVAYQQSIAQFNLVQEWDTVTIRQNPPIGELISAKAIRTIRHHNKLATISLPLAIGYQKQIGRWGFGAQAGIAFNFVQNQSGKAMNAENKISLYPNDETTDLPIDKFFISYQLKPTIYFRSSKKLAWHLRPELRYQTFGDSEFYGLKHNAWWTGVSLGLVYTP